MLAFGIVLAFWAVFFAGLIWWLMRHPEDYEILVVDLTDSKVP